MVAPAIAGFVSRAEWGASRPDSVSRNITPHLGGVTFHYGGPPQNLFGDHALCVRRVRQWQSYHMGTKGWSDIAYTGLFCNHGFAFAGRGAGVRTAANGTNPGNQSWYAVTWLGGDGEVPTWEAIAAGAWWVQNLRDHGNAAHRVNNHSDHKATACAGNPIRERLELFLPNGHAVPVGPSAPPVAPAPAPTGMQPPYGWPLAPGKYFGPRLPESNADSISGYYQRLSGDPSRRGHDGIWDWQERMVARGWKGVMVDGLWGPNMDKYVRLFQADQRLKVDGLLGPITWRAAWVNPVR